MKAIFIGLCAALIVGAGVFLLLPGDPPGGGGGKGMSTSVGREDVAKEVGEAVETTKDYLLQKKGDLIDSFDERMRTSEEKIDELRKGLSEAGESGRVKMEKHLEVLREKEEEVRRRYGELKESGAALGEEAGRKLDEALRELEEAYGRARESFDGGEGGKG